MSECSVEPPLMVQSDWNIKPAPPRIQYRSSVTENAPKIHISAEYLDQSVKVDQSIRFSATVACVPKSTLTWYKDGTEIVFSERVVLTLKEVKRGTIVNLVVRECLRCDAGEYKLVAANALGTDSIVARITVKCQPPAPQSPLTVSDITKDSCTLSWNAPLDDGGELVSNYVIEKKESNKKIWNHGLKVPADVTTCQLMNLVEKCEYTFRVAAENSVGVGDFVETKLPVVIFPAFDKPGTPVGPLRITDITETSVNFSWSPPKSDGGKPIENYIIESKQVNESGWHHVSCLDAKTFTCRATDLKTGTPHTFRVAAENEMGVGSYLEASEPIVPQKKTSPPATPTGPLQVVGINHDRVTLKWKPPPKVGGAPVEYFMVQMKNDEGVEWISVTSVNPNQFTCTITDHLKVGTSFRFRVYAKNLAGLSAPLESTKSITIPSRSGSVPSQPEGPLEVKSKTMSSITVEWKPSKESGGSAIVNYIVALRDIQRATWIEVAQVDVNKTFCNVTDLDQGAEYYIRVMARNVFGTSEPLLTEKPIVVERPPTHKTPPAPCTSPLRVVNIGAESVTIRWNPPEDDGGSPVTGYIISKRNMRGKDWIPVDKVPEFVNEYTVPRLKPNYRYLFRVNAVNDNGIGEGTVTKGPIMIKRLKCKPGKPGKPTLLNVDNDAVVISWTLAELDGGGPIGNYVVEKRDINSSIGWMVVSKRIIRRPPFVVEPLTSGVYEFRVLAENENGVGAPSEPSEQVSISGPIKDFRQPTFLTKFEIC